MDETRKLTTREKALKINLDPSIYGSFSEIGAGQETAATFFQAGAASGTIAMTTSAYDMKISDSIYGDCDRYVSKERLLKMLYKDHNDIQNKLIQRKNETRFFSFANTIETINFHRTNQGHGWLGVKFQLKPNTPSNECIIHVLLHDADTLLQQKAVGRLGVNLLYACFYAAHDPDLFLSVLTDSLAKGRVEIDMFSITGPDFEDLDNRLISLKLVKAGMTKAAMFGPDGQNLQPSDSLYKKNILVLRGRFRPPTLVNVDMLLSAYRQFKDEKDVQKKNLVVLCELTLNNLLNKGEHIDEKDFLDRVDILCSLGQTVIITNFQRYYKLITYLSNINREKKIGVILGIHNLAAIFDRKYYTHLKGGILEAFGRLFGRNVKLLVYPATSGDVDGLYTCENFQLSPELASLYQYLMVNNKIEDIQNANNALLQIFSDDVLQMIKKGEEGWEEMVPNKVAKAIKDNCLFDYPCAIDHPKSKQSKLAQQHKKEVVDN
ncbi:MAG: nicotinate-nucleotide adenylyltransferase [Crocinitomicaceae bacterium]|nr:nicotinate-nucleotide adenylyltransferase [Crocinitomicaceae bacterium]|tara:strand:+ start:885 stop:2360 length:1476 start_codon:yes stop_codon:yes gene_type:complete